jgi:hypothetical protein
MNKWLLTDDKKGNVLVSAIDEDVKFHREKAIYESPSVSFSLLFNTQFKTVGYKLHYSGLSKPKYNLFNSFFILNNDIDRDPDPATIDFEVIYEDQVIRLLAFSHTNGMRDYWLVGRWREEAIGAE